MNGTIIYLHGFASTGTSVKSKSLKDSFSNLDVIAPDLPVDPDETIQIIDSIVSQVSSYPLIFVGTSLGGFWANYFAQKHDAIAILINPSTRPDKTMVERIGKPLSNYVTGQPINVTQSCVDAFAKYRKEAESLYNGNLVHVFLAKDDETIDYKLALDDLKYFKSITITPTGSHRYNDHWNRVINKISELVTSQGDK